MNYRNFVYYKFFLSKFVGNIFVSLSFDLASASRILSHAIAERSIILAKYFPFLQIHIVGF